jgi:hypothetical protein
MSLIEDYLADFGFTREGITTFSRDNAVGHVFIRELERRRADLSEMLLYRTTITLKGQPDDFIITLTLDRGGLESLLTAPDYSLQKLGGIFARVLE